MSKNKRITCHCGKCRWTWALADSLHPLSCSRCGCSPHPANLKHPDAHEFIMVYDRTNIDSTCAAAILHWYLKQGNDITLTHHRFSWADFILSHLLVTPQKHVYIVGTSLLDHSLQPMEKLILSRENGTIHWFDPHPAIIEAAKQCLPHHPLPWYMLSSASMTIWKNIFPDKPPPLVVQDIDAYVRHEATGGAIIRVECLQKLGLLPYDNTWLPLLEDWEGYKDISRIYKRFNSTSLDDILYETGTLRPSSILGISAVPETGIYVYNSPIVTYFQYLTAKRNHCAILSYYHRWDGKYVVQFYSYNPNLPCTMISQKIGGYASHNAGFAILDKWEAI